jgi:N-acyl-D-amino-acid deacylase
MIAGALVLDGDGNPAFRADIGIRGDQITAIGSLAKQSCKHRFEADGLTLAPGFIDSHTHDDLAIIKDPQLLPKISQGVTTVIAGNCGISAAPVTREGLVPEPMNLLGNRQEFRYETFAAYIAAIEQARPGVNIATLVGHTTLRANHLDRLDRNATAQELQAMSLQLKEAMQEGALGLSTGLAYLSAIAASTEEVLALASLAREFGGVYATHIRTEGNEIINALQEAIEIGNQAEIPVIVSHLKCAGIDNWGRAQEVLDLLTDAQTKMTLGWDAYPYSASSTVLDLRQIDERVATRITWSTPYPEVAGQNLTDIAKAFGLSQLEAAKKLQPAGAIYDSMSEEDVQKILTHQETMVGSDGLPCDPHPHPRLWGTFPRVLGHFCRDLGWFTLPEAVRKMTSMTADRFHLEGRGRIKVGGFADLVLFDQNTIADRATFDHPEEFAAGIHAVWVNGSLTFQNRKHTGLRNGRFLRPASQLPNLSAGR